MDPDGPKTCGSGGSESGTQLNNTDKKADAILGLVFLIKVHTVLYTLYF
jgi:hypothetical protein